MALHTGQHILSRALVSEAGANTVSSRLGERACTIDVDQERLSDGALGRVEDLANAIIDDDLEVRAFYPSAAELPKLALRRPTKVRDAVRVVAIGDFDVTPCGGTHCTRSAQVGLVHLVSCERHRGGLRITFAAGHRARTLLGDEATTLRRLSDELSCGSRDVPTAIDKLRRELSTARTETTTLTDALAQRLASQLRAGAQPAKIARFEGLPVGVLQQLARHLCEEECTTALLATDNAEGLHVVLARGAESHIDCGAIMRAATERCGGRGGGRPDRAQGRLPRNTDWVALVGELLATAQPGN